VVAGERPHPCDALGVSRTELQARDLLQVREHLAHVPALVVAHQDQRARPHAEQIDDLERLWPSIDIVDADPQIDGTAMAGCTAGVSKLTARLCAGSQAGRYRARARMSLRQSHDSR
jgi:hypothetical protein